MKIVLLISCLRSFYLYHFFYLYNLLTYYYIHNSSSYNYNHNFIELYIVIHCVILVMVIIYREMIISFLVSQFKLSFPWSSSSLLPVETYLLFIFTDLSRVLYYSYIDDSYIHYSTDDNLYSMIFI